MKKFILIMLLISSLISLSGYGQSFKFKSAGTKFQIGSDTEITGNITIEPRVNGGTLSIIEKDIEYTIKANTEYTVKGDFTELNVGDNNLTSLDVSGLKALKYINCIHNDFDVCALDYIFLSLPTRPENDKGDITIAFGVTLENGKHTECRTILANNRNWIVTAIIRKGSGSFVKGEVQNTEPYGCAETSIPENLAAGLDIKVFPNPVRDALHIESEEIIKQVSVFDISGKLLIKELVNDVNFSLPTTDLYSGIYVLRIQTDKGINNIKVIKE